MPRFPPCQPSMRRLAVLALLALALGAAGPARTGHAAPEEPAAPAGDADAKAFAERVNKAIDQGRDYLLAAQKNDGLWFQRPSSRTQVNVDVNAYGEQALVLLALAKCGVEATHPQMKKGLQVLRAQLNTARGVDYNGQGTGGFHTYSASCVVQLYDALYVEHPKAGAAGRGARKPKVRMPAEERQLVGEIVDWLESTQRTGLWRYPSPAPHDEDLSATQYALLALVTAGRIGIHLPAASYRRALKHLLAWQQAQGPETPLWVENPAWDPSDRYPRWQKLGSAQARGWPYEGGGATITGSMTCAGVACLAIVKDRLGAEHLDARDALTKDEQRAIDKALTDGLAWLSANFDVKKNPGSGDWHYYYLYGLERACSLLGLEHVGQHAWYREGADYLVAQQGSDGAWKAGQPSGHSDGRTDVKTAFALLFLKRATVPTRFRAPAITGGGDAPAEGREEK